MADLCLDSHVRISEDAVFRELEGEAVILHLDAGVYFGLNPVGTRLWQMIGTHGQLRPVFDAALAEFAVDPQVLERDLLDLVARLGDKRLVVVS